MSDGEAESLKIAESGGSGVASPISWSFESVSWYWSGVTEKQLDGQKLKSGECIVIKNEYFQHAGSNSDNWCKNTDKEGLSGCFNSDMKSVLFSTQIELSAL